MCTNNSRSDIEWITPCKNILLDLDESLTVDTSSTIRLDCVEMKLNQSCNAIINAIEMKVFADMNVYNMKTAYR